MLINKREIVLLGVKKCTITAPCQNGVFRSFEESLTKPRLRNAEIDEFEEISEYCGDLSVPCKTDNLLYRPYTMIRARNVTE